MITADQIRVGGVYEIEDDYLSKPGNVLTILTMEKEGAFRSFTFLFLTGHYERRVVKGGMVQFNTVFSLEEIA